MAPRTARLAGGANEPLAPPGFRAAPAADSAPLSGTTIQPALSSSAVAAATQQDASQADADTTNSASPAPPSVAGHAPSMASPAAADARPSLADAHLAPVVGSPDWPLALARQVVRLAPGRDIELNLNPAELGPLKVKLSLIDSQAHVAFVSEHAGVRQALEAALPQLRTSFADSGISLGQTTVGSGSGEPRPHPGAGQQPAPERRGEPQSGAQTARSPEAPPPAAGPDGRAVDTFA